METIDKKFRWLFDLCGFYNGEKNDPFEKESKEKKDLSPQRREELMSCSFYWVYEYHWIQFIIERGEQMSLIRDAERCCPRTMAADDSVPPGIKAILISRIVHWTGQYPTDESFLKNTMEPYYRFRRHPLQVRKGARILNQMRLERVVWYSSHTPDDEPSPEQQKRFELVEAVDGCPFEWERRYHPEDDESHLVSSWNMVRMLEHADSHGFHLQLVQDWKTCCVLDSYWRHPEYQEIRQVLTDYLGGLPEDKEALLQYVKRSQNGYLYVLHDDPFMKRSPLAPDRHFLVTQQSVTPLDEHLSDK